MIFIFFLLWFLSNSFFILSFCFVHHSNTQKNIHIQTTSSNTYTYPFKHQSPHNQPQKTKYDIYFYLISFLFLILCLLFWTLVDLISSNDLVHLSIDYSYHKVLLFKTILSNCFLFLHVMCIARCSTWKTGIHSYSP